MVGKKSCGILREICLLSTRCEIEPNANPMAVRSNFLEIGENTLICDWNHSSDPANAKVSIYVSEVEELGTCTKHIYFSQKLLNTTVQWCPNLMAVGSSYKSVKTYSFLTEIILRVMVVNQKSKSASKIKVIGKGTKNVSFCIKSGLAMWSCGKCESNESDPSWWKFVKRHSFLTKITLRVMEVGTPIPTIRKKKVVGNCTKEAHWSEKLPHHDAELCKCTSMANNDRKEKLWDIAQNILIWRKNWSMRWGIVPNTNPKLLAN